MKFRSRRETPSTDWQRTLRIMIFAQLITAVGYSSIFPFLPLYVEDLGSNSNLSIEFLVGLVFSAQAFTMMIASPVWGMLADRYGRKLMVERSLFGGALILLLMAVVRSAEELILLRMIQGLVTGTLAATSALVAGIVPRGRTGYAMGLLQVGLGIGLALGPLIGGVVADAFGYAASFYITSGMLLSAGIMVWIGVNEKFSPTVVGRDHQKKLLEKWRLLLSGPGVMITYNMRFLSQLGRMMIIPIIPLFIGTIRTYEIGVNTFTGLVIAAGSAATTLSAIYLGRLGDRVGHRQIVIIAIFIAGLLYLPLSLVFEGWQILVLFALVGVAMGGVIPGISALLSSYTEAGEEGSVYGLDNSIQAGARSIAPLLGSAVALWFGLRGTFVATGVILLLASGLAAWRLPRPKTIVKAPITQTETRTW